MSRILRPNIVLQQRSISKPANGEVATIGQCLRRAREADQREQQATATSLFDTRSAMLRLWHNRPPLHGR